MLTKNRKRKESRYKQWRMYGIFDWARDYTSRPEEKLKWGTEEAFVAHLTNYGRKRYYATKANRMKTWYASRWYQRCLRMTLVELNLRERQKLKFLKRRFKNVKVNDIEIPAEASALITMTCFLNERK